MDGSETRDLDAPRSSVVGLDAADEQRTAEEFFGRLPWEPVKLDPGAMTAEQFLEAL